jgi:hypothetical protein
MGRIVEGCLAQIEARLIPNRMGGCDGEFGKQHRLQL